MVLEAADDGIQILTNTCYEESVKKEEQKQKITFNLKSYLSKQHNGSLLVQTSEQKLNKF